MANANVVRYFVAPAATVNGWFVRSVVLDANGKETQGQQAWKYKNKREAHAAKDRMNKGLGR